MSETIAPDLLNAKQVREKLGYSESQFFELKRRGVFRMLEVTRPIGQRRYSRVRVDQFCAGESIAAFGKGRNR